MAAAFAAGWHFGLFETPNPVATVAGTSAPAAPTSAPMSASASAASAPQASTPAPAASTPPAAPAEPAKTQEAGAAASAEPSAPSFDVVRVEPDGATVLAGRAAPNATVSLQSGTERLADVKTDASGAFALDLTLPVGQHRLALNDGTGRADASKLETAIVNVPPKGKEGELLVMLERPGEASEILVKPKPEAAMASTPATETPAPETKAETPRPTDTAALAPSAGEQATTTQTPAPQPDKPAAPAKPASPLSVEAVEAEGGKLFIAGAASEGARVRVYLDDALVAETRGGAGDRFIASAQAPVAVGDHRVRADEVNGAGEVLARVEVPFNRPDTAPLAAIAPPPAAEPAADAQTADAPVASPSVAGSAPSAPIESESPVAAAPAAPTESPVVAANAPPAGTTVQPALERVEARVIIRKGDTLWRISRNSYGRGSRFTVIYLANGDQIRDPNRIYPGQVFRVPDKDG
ncbi:LysM peptidoglycan-binding domain-containing protein [Aureimonas ureilytica]|uniref:LysM peptidoglycan-binding domain-containing protein n=1 Tax=Aureimonas ureilytica TaxID=401562 RepID=UPI0012DC2812|nr:LysM peptidoglycan-binding domain-containing protein [Aureimonas ureilytica]